MSQRLFGTDGVRGKANEHPMTAEIALALGIPVGTVKSRLHHATATLRADPACRSYFEIDP